MLKIICYNVREGLLKNYQSVKERNTEPSIDKRRYLLLLKFLNREKADLVGLLELSYWKKIFFDKLLHDSGYQDGFFISSAVHHRSGFLSRKRLTDKKDISILYTERFHKEIFPPCGTLWRTFSAVELNKIKFYLFHLHPDVYQKREIAFQAIRKIVSNTHTILMGDFNTLRRQEYQKVVFHLLSEKQRRKFGSRNQDTIIDKLVQFGFVDAFLSQKYNATVPTKSNDDKMHKNIALRLDYFLVSKDLNKKIIKQCIIKDDLTNKLSDHYPITINIAENRSD